ncbi:MAG: class I SAM-dependent methyltransferase, partial [Candidatus Eremiobacteraeota bacterium]|nr:class I SAM-dependent methyltransferase [Candidatus Eremiobacteraeota bacterium]
SLDVLQYVPDHLLDEFVRSCARTLKPGGRLILHAPLLEEPPRSGRFADWTQPGWMRQGFSASSLAALMRSNGLQPVSICNTVTTIAARAWEWNMLVAGRPLQSVAFPLLLMLATVGEGLPSRHHSCVLCVATRG